MDIKNTMCRLSDLTTEQVDSLRTAMPDDGFTDFKGDGFIGINRNGKWGTFAGMHFPTIISYDEMKQLLTGKSMGFTKTDLIELAKTKTVFVKYRNGGYRIYLDGIFNGEGWSSIKEFTKDLKYLNDKPLDVMFIYTSSPRLSLLRQLEGNHLTQVWERTELTPAQKEMEVLQAKMDELGEQYRLGMNTLYEQVEVVKDKL
jgi:hypothetical protein